MLSDRPIDYSRLSLGQVMEADGSTRGFRRGRYKEMRCVVVEPSSGPLGVAEARSAYLIGTHLHSSSVPVPAIYGFDPQRGLLIFEDCGDTRFHDRAGFLLNQGDIRALEYEYTLVLELLVQMELKATSGFSPSWCYDTPVYDSDFAFERECLYFLRHFLAEGGHEDRWPPGVEEELMDLAGRVDALAPAPVLIHRDFQSRNLMLRNEQSLVFIDFQGARLGPLGYDAASLLMDPYVNLPWETRWEMAGLFSAMAVDKGLAARESEVMDSFYTLALLRNLQVLGAFSFLSRKRGRSFFKDYIPPALSGLNRLLAEERFSGYDNLRKAVNTGESAL